MRSPKQEALEAISQLPDAATLGDIMYRLYVLDKVRRGVEEAEQGSMISDEELRREIETW